MFIGTLFVIQLWLLAASVESLLRGSESVLIPATIASGALAVVNAASLLTVLRFERRMRGRL
jgi:hypothetical protein